MSELMQSVAYTVHPNGIKVVHECGMLPKRRGTHRINVWFRWLSILKAKYHWNDEPKKLTKWKQ